jgi:hypothetical protein
VGPAWLHFEHVLQLANSQESRLKRRHFIYGLSSLGVVGATGIPKLSFADSLPARSLRVAVDDGAPEAIREAARSVVEAQEQPLLNAMRGTLRGDLVSSRRLLAGPLADRAYHHLILVGLPTDPLIVTAWQREARITAAGFYVFGFGTLKGDIGFIESDRNLFLHSSGIPTAPFETEVVTITGTTPAGVLLARDAFLSQHLLNGVVAAAGWSRPVPGLLDRDPLAPGFKLPAHAPQELNQYVRIGFSQASEDEYRGVLADTGLMPKSIWRAKYYHPGVWDHPGALAAFEAYSNGLHRRAYGNTRWIAEFNSTSEAAHAAPKIAAAAKLARSGDRWVGLQPYYANAKTAGSMDRGPLVLWQDGPSVLMSTVPGE